MNARRCPKNSEDWHDRILQASRCRKAIAVNDNRRDQNQWDEAVRLIEKSQKSIHIQKTGQQKGTVVGIPEKVANFISQIYIKIVTGVEPVIPLQHDGNDNHQEAKLEDDKLLRKMTYRSCNYAILAALYHNFRGPCEHVSVRKNNRSTEH